eukprot:9900734-Karenia_brevis.AAC.1
MASISQTAWNIMSSSICRWNFMRSNSKTIGIYASKTTWGSMSSNTCRWNFMTSTSKSRWNFMQHWGHRANTNRSTIGAPACASRQIPRSPDHLQFLC